MYKNEFDKRLQSRDIPQAVMLHGYEYYIRRYLHHLRQMIAADEEIKTNEGDYSFENAKQMLSQGSLFGSSSLFIYSGEKNLGKNDLKALLAICEKSPTSFFLYAPLGQNAKSQAGVFDKSGAAASVRFFEPSPKQALFELRKLASGLQIEIADHALMHLLESVNMDISVANMELQKLSLLQIPVTPKEIDNHVYSSGAQKFEDFFYDLLDNKPLLTHLKQLLLSGEDALKILRQAQYFFEQLFLINTHIKLKAPKVDISEVLGFKPPKFVVDKKLRYAQRLKTSQYLELFTYLGDLELQLKTRSKEASQKEPHLIAALLELQRRFH